MVYCKYCSSDVNYYVKPRPDTPHEAEIRCGLCHCFLGWKRKEKNEGKRLPQVHSPESVGIDYCEICLLHRKHLGMNETLDIHHIDDNPENNERINISVVCTGCHKLIHHQRTYRNHQVTKKFLIYEQYKEYISSIDLEPAVYEKLIKEIARLLGL